MTSPEIQLANLRNHMASWCIEDLDPDDFVDVYLMVARGLLAEADVRDTADFS